MSGRRPSRPYSTGQLRPNLPGAHFLTDRRLIGQLVRASGVGQGDLVFDLGAGYGALTAPLADTGARVIAVELDPALAARLRRRFADQPIVAVVKDDMRRIPLPRRPFHVVANPPFGLTTWLCRRLLGDRTLSLTGAELLLEWGAAKWLTERWPRDSETASWAARYDIRLVRRVPATSFSPPPSADAAHVSIARRC